MNSQNAISTMLIIENPVNRPIAPPKIEQIVGIVTEIVAYCITNYSNLIHDGKPCIPLDLHYICVQELYGDFCSLICKEVETVLQYLLFGETIITWFLLLEIGKSDVLC